MYVCFSVLFMVENKLWSKVKSEGLRRMKVEVSKLLLPIQKQD